MDKQVVEILKCVVIAFVVAMILSFLRTIIVDSFTSEAPVSEQKSENISYEMSDKKTEQETVKVTDSKDTIEIKILPMKKLSGMSKNEILRLRKNIVDNSIFDYKNYSPSPEVYRIEDGLPWIGAYEISCNGANKNPNIGNGASRESVGILNPAMLFYLNINSTTFSKRNYCSEIDYLIPHKLTYNPSDNTIRAYINYKDYYAKNKYFYNNIFTDANARDLGYKYSHMNKFKNIRFRHETNLSNSIVDTRSYYHKGYACGLPSGCNNNSPYVGEYEFYLTSVPASFNIKLWKKRPMSESQKADLNYMMIFE